MDLILVSYLFNDVTSCTVAVFQVQENVLSYEMFYFLICKTPRSIQPEPDPPLHFDQSPLHAIIIGTLKNYNCRLVSLTDRQDRVSSIHILL
jgi:hypothetical protein